MNKAVLPGPAWGLTLLPVRKIVLTPDKQLETFQRGNLGILFIPLNKVRLNPEVFMNF